MKTLPSLVVLTFAAALAAALAADPAPPLLTNAAKMTPAGKWQDYPTRLLGSLPAYQSTTDGALSTYGGIKAGQGTASGFFRTAKSGRRWWLIDPEGCRFLHVGVVAVAYPPHAGGPDKKLPASN